MRSSGAYARAIVAAAQPQGQDDPIHDDDDNILNGYVPNAWYRRVLFIAAGPTGSVVLHGTGHTRRRWCGRRTASRLLLLRRLLRWLPTRRRRSRRRHPCRKRRDCSSTRRLACTWSRAKPTSTTHACTNTPVSHTHSAGTTSPSCAHRVARHTHVIYKYREWPRRVPHTRGCGEARRDVCVCEGSVMGDEVTCSGTDPQRPRRGRGRCYLLEFLHPMHILWNRHARREGSRHAPLQYTTVEVWGWGNRRGAINQGDDTHTHNKQRATPAPAQRAF